MPWVDSESPFPNLSENLDILWSKRKMRVLKGG